MKATVNGFAMIVLPPNISVEEAEVLFSEVLKNCVQNLLRFLLLTLTMKHLQVFLMLMTYSSQVKLEYYLQTIC